MSAPLHPPPPGIQRRCGTCHLWAGHDLPDQRKSATCRAATPPLPDSLEVRPKLVRATDGWSCPSWLIRADLAEGPLLKQAQEALAMMLRAFPQGSGGQLGAHARVLAKRALRAAGVDVPGGEA